MVRTPGTWTAMLGVLALAGLACLLAAPAASAERTTIRSFDGTPIVVNFFPAEGLRAGTRAPTVLVGPGFSQPGGTDPESESLDLIGGPGLGPLRRAGYNVATFDPRGFGQSGGEANIDSPNFEARDVQEIIDYVAGRSDTQLDRAGDPRVGMAGASYGGGIQFVTAAIDRRVDAIVPVIAWNSLVTSLFQAGDLKAGWGSILCAAGLGAGTGTGLVGPNGVQSGSVAAPVQRTCVQGTATGVVNPADIEFFRANGPAQFLRTVRAPTLIIQGTVDTLFTLDEATRNFAALRGNGIPLRMMWFCGGHGACLTGTGTPKHAERRTIAWFDRWLRDDRGAPLGPRFEWLADDAVWRQSTAYPLRRTGSLTGQGAGTIPLTPPGGISGALVLATPAPAGALDVPISAATSEGEVLGAPRVELTYRGTAVSGAATHVYGQIVDEQRRIVVGNQATPIPLTLDGTRRSVTVDLASIAAHATPGDRYRLQIVPTSTLYYPQTSVATVQVESARVTLPIVAPATPSGTGHGQAGALRLSVTPRFPRAGGRVSYRFVATADGSRVRGARIAFGGTSALTGADGRATIALRFADRGRRIARATRSGLTPGTTSVLVRPARARGRGFTG